MSAARPAHPEVTVLSDGRIGVFVGTKYLYLPLPQARELAARLAAAIEQAETPQR